MSFQAWLTQFRMLEVQLAAEVIFGGLGSTIGKDPYGHGRAVDHAAHTRGNRDEFWRRRARLQEGPRSLKEYKRTNNINLAIMAC